MAEEKYKIGAYISRDTWEIITSYQMRTKAGAGKKLTQGQVIDEMAKLFAEKLEEK
ncbi:TPA: hypothetical protein VVI09_002144 [Streptococcus pneumoniae]|nr:Uncharacterised protein [Streptococcus pneumoniae]VPB69420.1 Uncharacterised protein [Streptococcus pneumoniae]HEU3620024.1 hypothetical protein [Streptococcus pneumoniae]HEU3734119.1 hypothetical protein [Streptococcus pneumoniae]HEV0214464.1 hypothetical protein [Streptococcus pneumoniae]